MMHSVRDIENTAPTAMRGFRGSLESFAGSFVESFVDRVLPIATGTTLERNNGLTNVNARRASLRFQVSLPRRMTFLKDFQRM